MTDGPTTLAALIETQAISLKDKPFLLFEDRTISFTDLNRKVNRAANGLAALGVGPGVGVSIMMANSPEWLYVHFGIQKLNAYTVPVNTGLKGEGLRHIIDHSDSSLLVADDTFVEEVIQIEDSLGKLKHIVTNKVDTGDVPDSWIPLSDLMQASDENPGVEIRNGELSALMYTSGTTGAPKGVVNRYIGSANAFGAFFQNNPEEEEEEIMYTCLPLFHANALGLSTLRALSSGTTLALSKRFSASRFWDEIRRYRVTTFNALGAMIPILLKQPKQDNDADNPVKTVLSAACPASVWEEFEKRYGVFIVEGYAAVDGGGFAVMNFGDAPKGSIGKPGNPYRLVDDDDVDVPVGTSGELIFEVDDAKAREVEYYKNEGAGKARIVGGWFHTGDMLHADEDGNLYFDDRKTDSLRRRGENISAWEVEREINNIPAVLESAVYGVPSDLGEDDVMVAVQLQPGTTLSAEELIAHCEKNLAKFMVPRYVEFRDALPKTGTHRTQKSVLKKDGVGPDTWDREAS